MIKTFERRMAVAGLEMRDGADGFTLTGYASTFNQPYDMGWYTESVDPGAFSRTLGQNPDVRLLINHDGLPLARTTSGTLILDTDSKGLRVQANLDPTDPDVQSLAPKMRRGDLNQMSFGFRTIEDSWSQDMSKRNMLALDLNNGDASIVTYPANPTAMAGLRASRAAGPNAEAITAALRCLETRSATTEDIASVLTRALGYFTAIDLIVDEAQEQVADALNIPNPDDDETSEPDEAARAAAALLEFRKRLSLSL
jgi:HK97 family phage prohead protease